MNLNNLKSKVVSYKPVKKMSELGWKKETVFCWVKLKGQKTPKEVKGTQWKDYDLMIIKNRNNETIIVYETTTTGFAERLWKYSKKIICDVNPSEASGEIWIQCKENGYIKEV